jgi:hypothetical protein
MKAFAITILSISSHFIYGQFQEGILQTKKEWQLELLTIKKDSLDKLCTIHSDKLIRVAKSATSMCDKYYYRDKVFSGWACSVLHDNKHRYRYELYEAGIMVRRIGYYDNGLVDVDFRMKDCENYGPSRMWRDDGGMYIDEYYSEPGVKDGLHKRWHNNGVIAREAKYEKGMMIYEKLFDSSGRPIKAR